MFAIQVLNRYAGQAVINAGANATSATIGATISDLNKALLNFSVLKDGDDTDQGAITGRIEAGGSTIKFETNVGVGGLNEAVIISWQILEFSPSSDLFVHRPTPFFLNGASSVVTIPSNVSNRTKLFPIVTACNRSTAQFYVRPEIGAASKVTGSDTTFTIAAKGTEIASTRTVDIQLLEFLDATSVSTIRTSTALDSSTTRRELFIASVDPDISWLMTYYSPDGNNIDESAVNSQLIENGTKILIERYQHGSDNIDDYWAYIAQGANFSVSTGAFEFPDTSDSTIATFAPAVARQISHHYGSSPGNWPFPTDAATARYNRGWCKQEFESTSEIKLERDSGLNDPAFGSVQVVQFGVSGAEAEDVSPFTDEIPRTLGTADLLTTLCELGSRVTARLGDRFDIARSDMSFWVNQAYFEVANMAQHDTLETIRFSSFTTGSPQRLLLPGDYNEPIVLSRISWGAEGPNEFGSRNTLHRLSAREFASRSASSGEPRHYALYDRFVEILESPTSNYSLELRYKEYPSVLTECSNRFRLSQPWRFAVLLRAEQRLAELIGDDEHAVRAKNEFTSYVASLDTDLAKRQKAKDTQGVTVSGYYRPRRKRPGRGRFSDPHFDER